MKGKSWLKADIDAVVSMWADNKTAAQIAKTIKGRSRNAVLGLARRLKLADRKQPASGEVKPTGANVIRLADRRPVDPNRPKKQKLPGHPEPLLLPDGRRHGVMDIGDKACRWPHGDPGAPDFHFCGQKPQTGKPYCEAHSQRAAAKNFLSQAAEAPDLQRKANNMHARMFG